MSGVLDHPVSQRIELETEARGRDRRIIEPIPRLHATGERGSPFGHLYRSGVSVDDCFLAGRIVQGASETLAMSRPDRGNLP
jgi:hypothetical protein